MNDAIDFDDMGGAGASSDGSRLGAGGVVVGELTQAVDVLDVTMVDLVALRDLMEHADASQQGAQAGGHFLRDIVTRQQAAVARLKKFAADFGREG